MADATDSGLPEKCAHVTARFDGGIIWTKGLRPNPTICMFCLCDAANANAEAANAAEARADRAEATVDRLLDDADRFAWAACFYDAEHWLDQWHPSKDPDCYRPAQALAHLAQRLRAAAREHSK